MEDKQAYEQNLPNYLHNELDAYKEALVNGSDILDCLWCELYGSINMAEISQRIITPEHANYLREKYLYPTRAR